MKLALLIVSLALPLQDEDPKERAALESAADELSKFAAFCATNGSVSAARGELERAIKIADLPKLREQLTGLEGKTDAVKAGFADRFAAERKKAYAKVADKLADAAAIASKAGRDGRFRELAALVRDRYVSDKALERLGFVYVDAVGAWAPKADAAKLQQGAEFIENAWVEAAAMPALNAKHASWENPWVLSDGVHELTTTLPYRDAEFLLGYAGEYRRFFLSQFEGAWDLQTPEGLLPIVVTKSQSELREQILKRSGGAVDITKRRIAGSAYYLGSGGKLNPCFVTLEPMTDSGKTYKIPLKDTIRSLTHEITHQIGFEYSKHAAEVKQGSTAPWAIESIAVFMPLQRLERGQWRLTHPKSQTMGDNVMESPYAWCQAHAKSIPDLAGFLRLPQGKFETGENYNVAGVLADFLLNGEGGRHRASYVKFLELAHQKREDEKSFDECFPGVDRAALQREFLKFVAAVKLD